MSARKSLGSMLGEKIEHAGEVRDAEAAATQEAPVSVPAPVQVTTAVRPVKWLSFERKETRQRADQIAWIEAKRKELNAQRGGAGERLTDNTLIRIAIDLLMQHGDELRGTTEDELRASIDPSLRDANDF